MFLFSMGSYKSAPDDSVYHYSCGICRLKFSTYWVMLTMKKTGNNIRNSKPDLRLHNFREVQLGNKQLSASNKLTVSRKKYQNSFVHMHGVVAVPQFVGEGGGGGSFKIGCLRSKGWNDLGRRWTREVAGLENQTIFMDIVCVSFLNKSNI